MKTVEYSVHGVPFADHRAEQRAREFFLGEEEYIHVSTDNFCIAVRVLIREGVIPHDQVQFLYEEVYIRPARSGGLEHWPPGFCDRLDDWLMRLL